jgi:hypothetical protein
MFTDFIWSCEHGSKPRTVTIRDHGMDDTPHWVVSGDIFWVNRRHKHHVLIVLVVLHFFSILNKKK